MSSTWDWDRADPYDPLVDETIEKILDASLPINVLMKHAGDHAEILVTPTMHAHWDIRVRVFDGLTADESDEIETVLAGLTDLVDRHTKELEEEEDSA